MYSFLISPLKRYINDKIKQKSDNFDSLIGFYFLDDTNSMPIESLFKKCYFIGALAERIESNSMSAKTYIIVTISLIINSWYDDHLSTWQ